MQDRHGPVVGVQQREVEHDGPLVAPQDPDRGPRHGGARPEQLDVADRHGNVGLQPPLRREVREQQHETVKAGVHAGRVEAVARIALARHEVDHDGVRAGPVGGFEQLERGAVLQSRSRRHRIKHRPAHGRHVGPRRPGRNRLRIAGEPEELGNRVDLPVGLPEPRPAHDLQRAGHGLDAAAHVARRRARQDHGLVDLEIRDRRGLGAEPVAGHRERHFGKGRARQQHVPVHHVVGQDGFERRVDDAVPFKGVGGEARAHQRVPGPGHEVAHRLGGVAEPEPLLLPRVGGQVRHGPGIGAQNRVGRDPRAARQRARHRGAERINQLGLAVVHRERRAGHVVGGEDIVDVGQQDRVRPDLDEDARAFAGRGLHPLGEQDRFADVAPPVARIEGLAGQDGSGHGRHEGGPAGVGRKRREIVEQRPFDGVDQGAVEGVADVELLHPHLQAAGLLAELVQRVGGARQRGGARAVIGRHRQVRDLGRELLGNLPRADHDRHAAPVEGELLVMAAIMDHLDGIRQVQDAGRLGGRDLADAVAHHQVGLQAEPVQGAGRGGLDGKDQRLRHAGLGDLVGERVARHHVGERPARQGAEQAVDLVETRAEIRVVAVGGPAHADPLAAVARVHEGHARVAARCRARHRGRAGLGASLGEGPENGRQVGAALHRQHEAFGQQVAPVVGSRRQRVALRFRRPVQDVGVAARQGAQGGPAVGRQHQQARRLGGGHGRLRGWRTRQDHVGIGAAEPVGAHPGQAWRAGPLQPHGCGGDRQVQALEIDVRIQRVDVQGGGQQVVFEGQRGLDDARDPGGRFRVADVGLDRADGQRRGAAPAEHLAERRGLDRVAHGGAGAVRLHEGQAFGIDAVFAVKLFEQQRLPLLRRQRDAVGAAVRIDPRAHHGGVDAVAARPQATLGPEHQDAAALRPHVAVGRGREGLAQARARQHGGLREVDELERRRENADPAHDRGLDPPRLQGLDGGVERHHGGGAGRVDREARAVQVIDVGDAVGQDRGGVAGGEIAVRGRQVEHLGIAVVGRRGADEHARFGSGEARRRDAGILQGLPGELQQQALLRVHLVGLARRQAERARVEPPDVVEHARRPGVAAPALALARVTEALQGPAIRGHLRDRAGLILQQGPKRRHGLRAGQAARTPDDRDLTALLQCASSRLPDIEADPCLDHAPVPRSSRSGVRTVPQCRGGRRSRDRGVRAESTLATAFCDLRRHALAPRRRARPRTRSGVRRRAPAPARPYKPNRR